MYLVFAAFEAGSCMDILLAAANGSDEGPIQLVDLRPYLAERLSVSWLFHLESYSCRDGSPDTW